MALKHACHIDLPIATGRFVELSKLVGEASCRPVPEWKAVVGEKVFSTNPDSMPMVSSSIPVTMKVSTLPKSV